MTNPALNWYADPSGRHEHRYWDETACTGSIFDEPILVVNQTGQD